VPQIVMTLLNYGVLLQNLHGHQQLDDVNDVILS